MKLIERTADRLVFGLGSREKTFLERLLSYYPILPDASPRLTREPVTELAEADLLLQDALREQKLELSGWLRLHLAEGEALRRSPTGWRLSLHAADIERLLQIFNELRVGAWTKLGCPESLDNESLSNLPGAVPFFAIMTLAGQFQMNFLHALEGGGETASGSEGSAS
jgi:hypothetical protein